MTLILSGTDGVSDIDGTAATPAIRGTDANTGIFFGTDIIGFSEGGVECARFDASANLQFNSGYGSVATAYGCRAWVNFNGTGTVAIRASGNVSSITDSGTGDYRVNFTTAMSDVNFVCEVSAYDASSGASAIKVQPYRTVSTSSQPVLCTNAAGTASTDLDQVHVTIFR